MTDSGVRRSEGKRINLPRASVVTPSLVGGPSRRMGSEKGREENKKRIADGHRAEPDMRVTSLPTAQQSAGCSKGVDAARYPTSAAGADGSEKIVRADIIARRRAKNR